MEPNEIGKDQVDMWQSILTAIPSMIEEVVKEKELGSKIFEMLWSAPEPAEEDEESPPLITLMIMPMLKSMLRLKYQEVLVHKLFVEEFGSSAEEREGIMTLVEKTLLLNLVKNSILTVDEAKGIFHNSDIEEITKTATKADPENLKEALKSLEEYAEHQKKLEDNPDYMS